MKNKIKITAFCIFFIFLFVGCCKAVITYSKENNSSEAVQGVFVSRESDKVINDENISEKAVENSENDKNENVDSNKTQEDKKKIVVLDPGHGNKSNLEKEPIYPGAKELKIKDGGGAEGINSKTPEYVIAMKITDKLKELLEDSGYNVIMTKTTPDQNPGNVERAEVGNENNADLVIRVHADSFDNSSVSGASMLVPSSIGYATDISEISKKYGQVVLQSLIDEAGMKNRGVVERNDITGFNWSKVPVILVETGFLSNPQEDELLNSEEYQNKIAKGLFEGIDKALNN